MKRAYRALIRNSKKIYTTPVIQNDGHCPICDQDVTFTAYDQWLRDHYRCSKCGSIPRQRALMLTIQQYLPNWRSLTIHESSPSRRGASRRISKECSNYIPSQYFPDREPGAVVGKFRCENLEALTFEDESIDLHITQDVLEHVFHPSKVFKEIARTLKPGGMHICTVPLVNKDEPSKVRARIENNEIIHLEPEQYHGNPVGDGRSLVTVDWGFDICDHIFESSGLRTHIVSMDDLSQGIGGEYTEVLVTVKPHDLELENEIP
ncbi:MAG: class I SAM-dependent methyltransferase [Phycisphaerales bacterium]|jgi:SAM-dependent methyltransferase|nr:class I SAM-dependent methyltransferase [Phycisphaerales bacterium]